MVTKQTTSPAPSRRGKNSNSKTQIIIKCIPRGEPIMALHIPESLGFGAEDNSQ